MRLSLGKLWFILILGLLLSLGAYDLSRNLELQTVALEQARESDLIADALSKRVELAIDTLLGLRGLFLASEEVEYYEFRAFANVYLEKNQDIQALEWVPAISHDLRKEFEDKAGAAFNSDFSIRERNSEGQLVSAPMRNRYFPVLFVHPMAGNENAIGFNLGSDARRLSALKASIKTREAVATASVNLVQETGQQKGVLIFMPVFVGQHGGTEIIDNSPELSGFALGVFRIDILLELAIASLQESIADLDVALIDVTDIESPEYLFGNQLPASTLDTITRTIDVAGRQWHLLTSAQEMFVHKRLTLMPWTLLLGGTILSALLVLYLRTLTQRNDKYAELVEVKSRDLIDSEARSDLIVKEAADAVITINGKGVVTSFNPAAERIFGYSTNEVVGNNVKQLMPEPFHSEHDEYLERYQNTRQAHIIGIGREVTGLRKDGSTFPLHLSVGQGRIDNQIAFVGILSDMTDRKRAEDALVKAKEIAETANRQKSQFLNVMSHELRTPLTVMLGYLPILKNKASLPSSDVISQIAEDMDVSGNHLLELINDLLDISKIEAGQMTLQLEKVQADELVEEILVKFKQQAEQQGVSLSAELENFAMQVDPMRFRQILINLVGNALKFTQQGHIKITGAVENNRAIFEVLDTGVGMPEEVLPEIFDAFKQVDGTSTRKVGGTGLGLAITKKLVGLHGGTISVSSELGKGSVFRFTLEQ